jgi:hypothetical protein
MEQNTVDEAVILTMVPPPMLRMLNKSLRKSSFREYVVYILNNYLEYGGAHAVEYINTHTDERIPFWIYSHLHYQYILEDGRPINEWDEIYTDIIGSTSSDFWVKFTIIDDYYQDHSSKNRIKRLEEDLDLVKFIDEYPKEEKNRQLQIGYANLYNYALERDFLSNLLDEDEQVVKEEVKSWVLSVLEDDYDENSYKVHRWYEWMYFNCVSLGIEVEYDVKVEDVRNEDVEPILSEEADTLYDLLYNKLDEILN